MSILKQRLAAFDEQLSYNFYKNVPKTKKWRSVLKGLEYSCHGLFIIFGTLGLVFIFPQYVGLTYLFGGLLLDVIYVALIKAATRRRRPSYTSQTDQLFMVLSDKHSFPSGHASRAFFIGAFTQHYLGVHLISMIIWCWALSVCCSRVLLGRHFIFDTIAGALFGLIQYNLQFGIANFLNTFFAWLVYTGLNVQFSHPQDYDDATFSIEI